MPGFSNYKESEEHESVSPITRKYYIENMNLEDVSRVEVTLPEMPVAVAEPPKTEEIQEQPPPT
jgi:hypothetical protein